MIIRCVLLSIVTWFAAAPILLLGQSPTPSTALIYEGFTEASQDILVSGSELGRLKAILVRMGDHVEEGQLLALMDDVQQLAAVKLAQAQASMTGDLELALAEEAMQRERMEKLKELGKQNVARPDEVQRGEAQWQMAAARVTQAKEQQQLKRLQLERDELQLVRRRITAPTSGVIARVLHAQGEYITPADSAIFQLLYVDLLEGVFNIPAAEMKHVRVGQDVRVFLRSCSETAQGVIDRVSPSIDGKSGTVQVRVRIENPNRRYLHGDRCTLRLTTGAIPTSPVLKAPSSAAASDRRLPGHGLLPTPSFPLADAVGELADTTKIVLAKPAARVIVQQVDLPQQDVMKQDVRLLAPEKSREGISREWLKEAALNESDR